MSKRRKKQRKRTFIWLMILIILILAVLLLFTLFKHLFCEDYKVDTRVPQMQKTIDSKNSDYQYIAWIKVQGTNIDYPVMYNNNFDLSYATDDFAWSEWKNTKKEKVTYLFGHNILNQSAKPEITNKQHTRFEQLMSFTYYDFVKKNQFIQYTIDGKDYLYQIFSIRYSDENIEDIIYLRETNNGMDKYITQAKHDSIFDFDVSVDSTDSIISLSTCTKMFESDDDFAEKNHFIVTGKLLKKNEKAKLKKVEKTFKYKEVENKMKGDDFYDET